AALGPDRAVGVAAAGGEVVGADDRLPSLDLAPAANVVGRGEVSDAALVVVGGEAGDAAHLAEAARIEQQVDALAAGELAAVALAHDAGIGRSRREASVGEVLQGAYFGQRRAPTVVAVNAMGAGAFPGRDGRHDLPGRD